MKHTSWFIAAFVFMLDRLSKYYVVSYLTHPVYVTKFLIVEKIFNRGIVWGIMNNGDNLSFIIMSVLVIVVYMIMLFFLTSHTRFQQDSYGVALILSGGFANIIDRLLYGGVVDFITISYAGFSWPTFNIADMAIVCGVLTLIVNYYRSSYEHCMG